MMKDRDKFLTEAMGECYHDRQFSWCNLCKKQYPPFYDFSTWPGMGKLREFYDTWDEETISRFRYYVHLNQPALNYTGDYLWHKYNTANLMYGFLKEQDA